MVAADAAALCRLVPHWPQLTHDLLAPRAWVDRVGADAVAIQLGATALWCVALWLAIGLLAASASAVPGACGAVAQQLATRLLPAALIRVVAGAAGFGVLMAPVAAGASPVPTRPAVAAAAPAAGASALTAATPTPGWPTDDAPLPRLQFGWPTTAPAPSSPSDPPPTGRPPGTASPPRKPAPATQAGVTVRPGDCLWLIAARRLGPDASAQQIAADWPHWYQANRAQIGDDPAVIHPGQLLRPPTTR